MSVGTVSPSLREYRRVHICSCTPLTNSKLKIELRGTGLYVLTLHSPFLTYLQVSGYRTKFSNEYLQVLSVYRRNSLLVLVGKSVNLHKILIGVPGYQVLLYYLQVEEFSKRRPARLD